MIAVAIGLDVGRLVGASPTSTLVDRRNNASCEVLEAIERAS